MAKRRSKRTRDRRTTAGRLFRLLQRLLPRPSLVACVWASVLGVFLVFCYGVLPSQVPGWVYVFLGLACAAIAAVAYLQFTRPPDVHNDLLARMRRGQHLDFGRQIREERKEPRRIRLPFIGETPLRSIGVALVLVGVFCWWLTPWAPVGVADPAIEDMSKPLAEEITSVRLVCPDGSLPIVEPPITPVEARRLARKMPDSAGKFPQALKAIAEGDFAKARQGLTEVMREAKVEPFRIHAARALAEMYAGNYAEAKVWYKTALLSRPNDPDLLCQAAVASIHQGDLAGALERVMDALAVARSAEDNDVPLAMCLHIQAAANLLAGRRPDQTEVYNEQARDMFSKTLGPGSSREAATLNNQAVFRVLTGNYRAGRNLSDRAIEAWRRGNEKDGRVATGLVNLATCQYLQGDYPKARASVDAALVIRRNTVRPRTPVIALTAVEAARIDLALGEYDEARRRDIPAQIDLLEKAQDGRGPCVAVAMTTEARRCAAESLYAPAENHYARALDVLRHAYGARHVYLVATLLDLAGVQLLRGHGEEALRTCESAETVMREDLLADHPLAARGLVIRAKILAAGGQYHEARKLLEEALEIARTRYPADSPRLADMLALLASLEDAPGMIDGRVGRYGEALEMYEKTLGEKYAVHPAVADIRFGLARLYLDAGRYAEARQQLHQVRRIREAALVRFHPALADTLEAEAEVLRHLDPEDAARASALERRAKTIRTNHLIENRRAEAARP